MSFEEMCSLAISNGNPVEQEKKYYVCEAFFCGKLVDPDHPHSGCAHTMSEIRRMMDSK